MPELLKTRGDQIEFKSVEERISVLEQRLEALEERLSLNSPNAAPPKKLSATEFLREKLPKGSVEETLALGFYLERFEGLPCFNVKDLAAAFSRAKVRAPNNLNLAVLGNVKKGHMMEMEEKKDGRKAWTLTATGEDFMERDLPRARRS